MSGTDLAYAATSQERTALMRIEEGREEGRGGGEREGGDEDNVGRQLGGFGEQRFRYCFLYRAALCYAPSSTTA
eukprot:1949249-Rhodomonas_salina.3